MPPDTWDGYLPSAEAESINRARMANYGDPTPNMEMFAGFLTVLFGHPVSAEQAAMVMVLLKVMREVQSGFSLDQLDHSEDICGFVNVLYKVKEAHGGRSDQASKSQQDASRERRVGESKLPERSP